MMTKMKRKIYLAVLAVAIAAMALPAIGVRVGATSGSSPSKATAAVPVPAVAAAANPAAGAPAAAPMTGGNSELSWQRAGRKGTEQETAPSGMAGRLSDDVVSKAFGITRNPAVDSIEMSKKVGAAVSSQLSRHGHRGGTIAPEAGEPANMMACSAFSAAIITSEGGRDTQFDEVLTLGDWDGLEDFSADHSGKVDDFSLKQVTNPGGTLEFTITRAAISEHTMANGFNEDIFYYADSFGNLYIAATTNLTQQTPTPNVFALNLPTLAFAFGSLATDDQIVITGLAVSPVVDLTSFSNVNGAFASFANQVGEVLYVTFTDTETGFHTTNGSNVGIFQSGPSLFRSGVLA